jgi:serine/threonine protein kinase
MGLVYLAHNRLLGRNEVLKVAGHHLVERPNALDRFLGEIRNTAKLHHPNIIAAYSALRFGESLVLAMEYVEGLDLALVVKARGPLPVANACNYIHQAALGLQHVHERGMVHRDIKPSNLMLAREGDRARIKVLDFGLAKATPERELDLDLTGTGQMLGTPDFIAPEQTIDAQGVDIRADIYSLGCTLYDLLTGGPPFRATTLDDVLQAHHSMDAKPLNIVRPEVPAELAALVANPPPLGSVGHPIGTSSVSRLRSPHPCPTPRIPASAAASRPRARPQPSSAPSGARAWNSSPVSWASPPPPSPAGATTSWLVVRPR